MKITIEKLKRVINEALTKKDKSLRSRLGQCYVLSGRYVSSHPGSTLVHGSIEGMGNPRIGHAWVELEDGQIFDPIVNQTFDPYVYNAFFKAIIDNKYTFSDTLKITVSTGHWGPW